LTPRDSFLSFITAERLYTIAAFFAVITTIVVGMIYVFLYQKKRRFFVKKRISEILDEWISEALLEEGEIGHTHVTPELLDYFVKEKNRQFAIDRLVAVKKNITGLAARNIIRLYEQLDLRQVSLHKFHDDAWYVKAKGIYELYMMGQKDMAAEIAKHTNATDGFVRTEAQTATMAFFGFEGLNFLNTLTYPLNDWEQVKVLEQLQALDPEDMPDLPKWLQSSNDYVVLFALKLAEIYYQLHSHDYVLPCLEHADERLRRQAIITISRIANEDTPGILLKRYGLETRLNQRMILQQLSRIGTDEEAGFLLQQLKNVDYLLKLESARTLAKCCTDGMEMLEEIAVATPEPYLAIYNHIKSELKR
jgi:hypothetical protein